MNIDKVVEDFQSFIKHFFRSIKLVFYPRKMYDYIYNSKPSDVFIQSIIQALISFFLILSLRSILKQKDDYSSLFSGSVIFLIMSYLYFPLFYCSTCI